MRINVEHKEKIGFLPVRVLITIESEEELADLIARVNLNAAAINQSISTTDRWRASDEPGPELFNELSDIWFRKQVTGEIK